MKNVMMQLIGTEAEVTDAKEKTLLGTKGTITDETRNTIRIKTSKGTKTIIKDQVELKIGDQTIDGRLLVGRTEERLKSVKK